MASQAPLLVKGTDAEYDPHPQYQFSYSVSDPLTGDSKSQEETRDGDVVRGFYSLVEPDGSLRTVTYTADAVNGFNAQVNRAVGAAPAPVAVKAAPVAVPAFVRAAPIAAPAFVRSAPIAAPARPYYSGLAYPYAQNRYYSGYPHPSYQQPAYPYSAYPYSSYPYSTYPYAY